MAKRNCEIALRIYLSEDEYRMIKVIMKCVRTTNISAYARKMMINGYTISCGFEELKALPAIISRLAVSINQAVKRCNEPRSIYKQVGKTGGDAYLSYQSVDATHGIVVDVAPMEMQWR